MNQPNNLQSLSKNAISREVTLSFLQTVEQIIQEKLYPKINNEGDLAEFININQSLISKLKSDKNRYVSVEMIAKLVNLLGANSNKIFVTNEKIKKEEKLIRSNFNFKSVGSHNTSTISGNTVKGAVVNANNNSGKINANTILKIINGMPEKDRAELKNYLDTITSQNSEQESRIEALKKTIAQCERKIKEKEKQLVEKDKAYQLLSEKYVALLEASVSKKKR